MTDWFNPKTLFGDQQLSIGDHLPLQTQAAVSAPPVQKPSSDDSDLPVMPQGALRDALMGKFNDPEIPSGIPDEKQQQQAFTHRLIGNAVGDTVSNLQNTANILKPGAGNPAMGESSRRFGDMLAEHALGNAKARRDEALQNFQIKDAADQRHEKMFQMATALKQQQDMRNPNSDLSRSAQQQEAERLKAMLAVSENHEINKQIIEKLHSLPGASAEQLAGRAKNDTIEHMIEYDNTAQNAANKQNFEKDREAREGKTAANNAALGWANYNLGVKKESAQEAAKLDAKVNKDKSIEKDVADLRNTRAELMNHLNNLKNGTVDNDATHTGWNYLKKKASSLGIDSIEPDQALQGMLTSVPLAQGTVEKAVTGSSRWNPERWKNFSIEEGEGTKNSINKLKGAIAYLDELEQSRTSQLDTKPSGEPASTSGMAKALPMGAIQKAAMHSQDRVKPAGAIKNIKGGGKAQQQPDGSWKRIE